GLPLVLFLQQRDNDYTGFAYTNGTWFQLVGSADGGKVQWGFTHLEPYLRRTYKGTTAELRQVVVDGLAGKRKPPPVNPKEKPGRGRGVEPRKTEGGGARNVLPARSASEGGVAPSLALRAGKVGSAPVFAVIPTVFVGGPLAVLAMLFPAVFGGLLLFFRRWVAGLSGVRLHSTGYPAQSWVEPPLRASRWGPPPGPWP